MERLTTLAAWRATSASARATGSRVGLVPTMGALHRGHRALVEAARGRDDVVVMSVFVNPRQFNDADDLARYPRDLERDAELAAAWGVDVLVAPEVSEMWPDYPAPTPTTVHVAGVSEGLEGADRPGHFDGVASVVAKLLSVHGPGRAYFGEKDFQQLAVVRQMVRDLALDNEIIGVGIVRDEDGLALSSRNVRLSPAGRERALALPRALTAVARAASPAVARATLRATLESAGVEVAYAEVVEATTLRPRRDDERGPARALVAGVVEGVRLIDNAPIEIGE